MYRELRLSERGLASGGWWRGHARPRWKDNIRLEDDRFHDDTPRDGTCVCMCYFWHWPRRLSRLRSLLFLPFFSYFSFSTPPPSFTSSFLMSLIFVPLAFFIVSIYKCAENVGACPRAWGARLLRRKAWKARVCSVPWQACAFFFETSRVSRSFCLHGLLWPFSFSSLIFFFFSTFLFTRKTEPIWIRESRTELTRLLFFNRTHAHQSWWLIYFVTFKRVTLFKNTRTLSRLSFSLFFFFNVSTLSPLRVRVRHASPVVSLPRSYTIMRNRAIRGKGSTCPTNFFVNCNAL